ncbi:sterol desaturase family protein [Chitinophaga sp. S165]|uniref:sterol desaturase family protein n=1 Tax=Chitinophaga sp. S165 TaxID=2135462 RepID=UPI000D715164|nr:sterol desaturase family protein [Chitinophaga sp. S165]PWV49605.1 sterol desaturase/sphingolipid hydroxylase (fatty acid hydroxylase superfamily) [Chitinophaga sp. S165]
MIELLAHIQPIVLIIMLIIMYGVENLFSYLPKPANRNSQDLRNFSLSILALLLNAVLSVLVVMVLELAAIHQWGLLNRVSLPVQAKIVAGVLLFDFGSYMTHYLQHKVPFFWRFHSKHHSPLHLSSSPELSLRPMDIVLAQCLYQCVAVVLTGISPTAFVFYSSIAIPLLILKHSNIKLPHWLENAGRLVIATPGWHKIHHSSCKPETDSHFGDVFSIWDRIFGTCGQKKPLRSTDTWVNVRKTFSRKWVT